jgi:hypothetical protein
LAFKTRAVPDRKVVDAGSASPGLAPRERRTAIDLIERARPFAESSGSAYLKGLQELALASFFFSSGKWREGLAHATEAERVFCAECRLAWWELATSRNTVLFCLVLLGDIPALARLSTAWLEDARARGDRYSATTISVYPEPGRRLAVDNPGACADTGGIAGGVVGEASTSSRRSDLSCAAGSTCTRGEPGTRGPDSNNGPYSSGTTSCAAK